MARGAAVVNQHVVGAICSALFAKDSLDRGYKC